MISRTTPRESLLIIAIVALAFSVTGCRPAQTTEDRRETPDASNKTAGGRPPAGAPLTGSVIANGVAADPNALGYLGYAYYAANRDQLKLVAIDNGQGCVIPSPQTVVDNSYAPLSRPIFVYLSKSAAARPEAKALARFCVDPDHVSYVRDIGYVPMPTVTLLAAGRRLDKGVTGSIFRGRGSVLGVTADTFRDEDRAENLIVQ
jgi:hypothetical protein